MNGCVFDGANNIGDRLVRKEKEWYSFVPRDLEIYGHAIVTVEKPCIREIGTNDDKIVDALKQMSDGIKHMVNILKEIDNVQRVYVAMLGESNDVHMHYHLIPRYRFKSDVEIDEWTKKNRLRTGNDDCDRAWREFYARPTADFHSFEGFQYFGEIEKSYDKVKRRIGRGPSDALLEEMAKKLQETQGQKQSLTK